MDFDALLTVAEAAEHCGVKPVTIRQWRYRGHLPIATDERGKELRDGRGRPLFRLLDVARAEFKTREAARRTVAPPPTQDWAALNMQSA